MLERVETGNAAAGDAANSTGAAGPVVGPIARRPLHEEAVDRLRSAIVQGELAPGIRLNERVLSERLGISRRALVSKLEQYNLPRPRKPREA